MISRSLRFILAVFLILSAPAESADKIDGYTIGRITIVRNNIFDLSKPEESGAIGRWGNRLHIITRDKVIRLELLFKEGDPFNADLIEESERNLRKFDFLTDVRIKPVPNHETRTVDVFVSTRDQWSLIIGGTFGGTSENAQTGLDLGEKNLLGEGISLSYTLRHDNGGDTSSYGFRDTTFLDTRYTLDIAHKVLPDEKNYIFLLEKPFYSIDTKTAHGITHNQRNHDGGNQVFDSLRTNAYYGVSFPFKKKHIIRARAIVSLGEQKVRQADNSLLIDRDNKAGVSVEFLFDPRKYNKATYIEKFRQVEDIAMGRRITLTLAPRLKSLGSSTSDVFAVVRVTRNYLIGERDYLFTLVELRRNDDSFNKQFADFDVRYYMRWFEYQTILYHIQVSYSESETNRFMLGGTNGVRGYKVDEFSGKNQLVLNVEDRIFTYVSMFSGLIEPGFVVFADFGNTWNDETGDKLTELHGGAGVGLRLALLKAPGISLIRVDYGYSLDMTRSPIVTFGMEGFF
ncbi:MAG: BamA/TamA family outer membrane protein [Nitrospinota bacterium]